VQLSFRYIWKSSLLTKLADQAHGQIYRLKASQDTARRQRSLLGSIYTMADDVVAKDYLSFTSGGRMQGIMLCTHVLWELYLAPSPVRMRFAAGCDSSELCC
jgi:hypothetical protein